MDGWMDASCRGEPFVVSFRALTLVSGGVCVFFCLFCLFPLSFPFGWLKAATRPRRDTNLVRDCSF